MRFAGGMTYRVEFAERAARDLNLLYVEKHATDSTAAARWYNRLEKAVYSLESSPYRCPVAPERSTALSTKSMNGGNSSSC
jgi:plasmid stabilization system protein ParE